MKVLFVGGPLDGKWMEIPDTVYEWRAWNRRTLELLTISPDFPKEYIPKEDIVLYKRMQWSSVYGKRCIFGLENMNEMEVFDLLMKGYKNEN